MIDLSNHDPLDSVDFTRLYTAGQRRVYLKVSQGAGFVDQTYRPFRARALRAGLLVGGYHYATPHLHTPREEADHFLSLLPALDPAGDLRPCLDLEQAAPAPWVGRWANQWRLIVREHYPTIIYGNAPYLAACHFPEPPAPLWLASYGRNDGIEHPYAIPKPWTEIIAHQYASRARVVGCTGLVDISHVYYPGAFDLPGATAARARRAA